MKILILGAGGIGGYFGAQLARTGADVTYLLRPKRQADIDAHGLVVETPKERFVVKPKTVTAETAQPGYDLIILTPKSYDLDDALAALGQALGSQSVVLPFLNGLDHLQRLDQVLGRERVMGGVAHIAATLGADGVVRQLSDMHRLTVGARHPGQVALAQAFMDLCEPAPFENLLVPDIEQVLWEKWVFLAALAAMTTACRGTVGQIMETPHGLASTLAMYAECVQVADRSGHPIAASANERAVGMLTAKGSSFAASMLRDLQAGQRTEYQHILGALITRAQALGCSTPLLQLAHTHMSVQAAR
jgi:2-dehydropantoate 2-reductase